MTYLYKESTFITDKKHLNYVLDMLHPPNSTLTYKYLHFYIFIYFFYICTVHLDFIKVYFSPTNAQMIVLKTILKFAFNNSFYVHPVNIMESQNV